MPLNHAFRLSAILLAATSFTSLALALALPIWLLSLASVTFALAFLRIHHASRISGLVIRLRLSAITWNVFLLLAFVGFWIDLLLLSQELLPAGIHFLVLLLVNKLANLDQRQDVLHLYAISVIILLASAALTTQIWYAPVFFLYLVTGVWTLLLYHLVKEQDEGSAGRSVQCGQGRPASSPTRITVKFFWLTNAVAFSALLLTLLFFFFIPRIGAGFFQQHHGESLRTTGFTEHVDLGAIGPVKQDPNIVMRIELPELVGDKPRREPLYLRGVAYNRYNGRSWSNSLSHRRMLTELPQGTFTHKTPGSKFDGTTRGIRQDILLEPLDTAVLFGISTPFSIKGGFLSVQADLMGSLHLPFPSHTRLHYTVYSLQARLESDEERVATAFLYPEFIVQQYLQVPALDVQIIDIARRVTRPATSILETVQLIRAHLLTSYRYNLDVPSLQSAHPLEDFLLTRKTGYCEHYATAMVMLLRSVGVPARLVTGFLATEWNEFGNYYTVRQRDAHAWVEVYFPQSGWITMDPTPSASEATSQTWWRSAGSVVDSVRLKWDSLFINYSVNDQFGVVQGIRESGEAVRTKMSESLITMLGNGATLLGRFLKALIPSSVPRTAILIILAIMTSYLVLHMLRGHERGSSGGDSYSMNQRVVVTLYTSMVDQLSKHGIRKGASTTPLEFLHHVRDQWPEAWPAADALTRLYTRVRFGQAPLTAEECITAQRLLHTLQTLRRPVHLSLRR
jgi:transglutaminase-like putative cysteine protease